MPYLFRDPAVGIEKPRASGQVIEVKFPIVGKVWIRTIVWPDNCGLDLRRPDCNLAEGGSDQRCITPSTFCTSSCAVGLVEKKGTLDGLYLGRTVQT